LKKADFYSLFYDRELPHYQPLDATYAVIFRLAGSLPAQVVQQLRQEREEFQRYVSGLKDAERRRQLLREHSARQFEKFESLLDGGTSGPHWLANNAVAEIVAKAMHYWDGRAYELLCYCTMPNHVHAVFSIGGASTIALPDHPLKGQTPYVVTNILSSIKKWTAKEANRILKRRGMFWQDESYDHVIKDGDELKRQIWYALNNPVNAGLVTGWRAWKWSYVKGGLIDV